MCKSRLFVLGFVLTLPLSAAAQTDDDAWMIQKIHHAALTQGVGYEWLTYLTQQIGGRLSGSPQAAAAVAYTRQMLDTLGLDTVYLQPCTVPHWVRGGKEVGRIVNSPIIGTQELSVLALGNSVGTGEAGVVAQVVEVKSLDEVRALGKAGVSGKIVFYNRPMDATKLNTFAAYGGAVDQRGSGAAVAANYGAVAVLVRSMTTLTDDFPHTGSLSYHLLDDGVAPIPALAVSTADADLLSRLLVQDTTTKIFLKSTCVLLPDEQSYNVIGELRGSQLPNELILVGGHLDSWDVGQGAHDDGAGCVQAMDVLQVMKRLGYRPKRTIRCVLFMNEENGLRGGAAYAAASNLAGEFHIAAIESDRGGFTPRGFTVEADAAILTEKLQHLSTWLTLLAPYGLKFEKGGSGADISGLKSQKGTLFGYLPDSQRYFDYHHAATDVLEAVNRRELDLGTAAMLSLVYLTDQYGL